MLRVHSALIGNKTFYKQFAKYNLVKYKNSGDIQKATQALWFGCADLGMFCYMACLGFESQKLFINIISCFLDQFCPFFSIMSIYTCVPLSQFENYGKSQNQNVTKSFIIKQNQLLKNLVISRESFTRIHSRNYKVIIINCQYRNTYVGLKLKSFRF